MGLQMKILMVNKFLHPNGGSETYIFKLGEQLSKMGHEVQYFGMEHENRCVGNEINCYINNMDFHDRRLQKLLYPFKIIYSVEAKKKMQKVLDFFQPDVVHMNNFNFQLTPSIIYAIRKYNKKSARTVKIIYTAHDSQLVCPNHLMQNSLTGEKCQKCLGNNGIYCVKNRCIHGSFIKSFLACLEHEVYKRLRVYKYFDKIICPSVFMKEVLDSDSILKNKTIVMHNFVDVQMGEIDKKEDYVLYFGRFSKEKGIETLLKVCNQLRWIQFVFAGSGPLEEKINSCTNVKNVGFLSGQELYRTIARAKFTIFPSECYENCPFAVMESQMCLTPVIGSNLGGIPELLIENMTGLLFESGNIEELKGKIEMLWGDKRKLEKMTMACKKAEFDDLKIYIEKLLKIYETA